MCSAVGRCKFVLDIFCQQLWSVCGVSVCPLGTRLRHVHVLRYVLVLDIFCQLLWSVVHLGGVCVPFGHKVEAFTCSEFEFAIAQASGVTSLVNLTTFFQSFTSNMVLQSSILSLTRDFMGAI